MIILETVTTEADAARRCVAVEQARCLASWVGTGRPVTTTGVLRRADVPAAARVLGISAPSRVRSAGDVIALHRAWTAAVGAGLIAITNGQASETSTVAGWTSVPDGEILDRWPGGLAAVLGTIFDAQSDADGLDVAQLVLTAMATDPPTPWADLPETVTRLALSADLPVARVFATGLRGTRDPAADTVEVLLLFGALHDGSKPSHVTPLGRWLSAAIAAREGVSRATYPPPAVAHDQICQLQIRLTDIRPPCWRRVLVPASATLGTLHDIIQVVMDWDEDHLHMFTVGHQHYGDPFFDAESDEDATTLADLLTSARSTIRYVYDLGDNWRHDITLEKTLDRDPDTTYPVCVDGRGDAPVEDWSEEDDERTPTPYDTEAINRRLAELAGNSGPDADAELDDMIETIIVDCYNDSEAATAFLTVLEEEVTFPVEATLLDTPVVVTGLDEDDTTFELQACCLAGGRHTSVSFGTLTFPSGSVAAWLQAAYLRHRGRPVPTVSRPARWSGLIRWA